MKDRTEELLVIEEYNRAISSAIAARNEALAELRKREVCENVIDAIFSDNPVWCKATPDQREVVSRMYDRGLIFKPEAVIHE